MKQKKIVIKGSDGRRRLLDPEEVELATYGDYFVAGYGADDLGLTKVGETDDGEPLYEGVDFDGQKTKEELEGIETVGKVVRYWDGNNWRIDIYEEEELDDIIEVEIDYLDLPSPAYSYPYQVTFLDGEKAKFEESNVSGSISPYLVEVNEDEDDDTC